MLNKAFAALEADIAAGRAREITRFQNGYGETYILFTQPDTGRVALAGDETDWEPVFPLKLSTTDGAAFFDLTTEETTRLFIALAG